MIYILEDGHIFDNSDIFQLFSWKINELRNEGYSEDEILHFDDSILWYDYITLKFNNSK